MSKVYRPRMDNITRRHFLRGASGLAFGLPLLRSLDARAQAKFPKRFLVFFHPNGTIPDAWFPNAGTNERNFTFNEILEPLERHRDDLLVLQGVHMEVPDAGPGEPHQQGMGAVLTGRRLQEGTFVGGDGSLAGWGDGISVDQVIAAEIGQNTQYPSLQLGVRATALRFDIV